VQNAPRLYVTAALALTLKALLIPAALRRIVRQLDIHREVETAVGIGPTMLVGVGLVALSIVLMLKVTAASIRWSAGSCICTAVILLGLLMMVTAAQRVSQVVGFMSLENGLSSLHPVLVECRSSSKSASRFSVLIRVHRHRPLFIPHS